MESSQVQCVPLPAPLLGPAFIRVSPSRRAGPHEGWALLFVARRSHITTWKNAHCDSLHAHLHPSPLRACSLLWVCASHTATRSSFLCHRGRQCPDCEHLRGAGQEDGGCRSPAGGDHAPAVADRGPTEEGKSCKASVSLAA